MVRNAKRFGPAVGVSALAIATLPVPVLAAGSSGQITLRGTVPTVCTVSLSTSSATLDLVKGQSGAVATVEEQCNAAGGYTVSVASRNGGQLRRDGATSGVAYSMLYDQASGAGTVRAERASSGAPRRSTLSVNVPASPQLDAGEYSDIVTVSIVAK